MELVERERETKAVTELFEEGTECGRGVVVISGPVASGKTELLEKISDGLERAGAIVLKAAACRTETEIPLGVVGQLVGALESVVHMGQTAGTEFDRFELDFPWTMPVFDISGWRELCMLRALCTTLARLGQQRPVLICVDDADYADAPSLVCLLYLARRLRTSGVLLLLSDRDHPRPEYQCFQADILREAGSRHILLGRLSRRGIALLLSACVGSEPTPELTARVHRLTGGNPLLLRSLVEDHQSRSPETRSFDPGPAFAHSVTVCLLRCDHLSQEVARALALLGDEEASPDLLSEVVGTDRETAVRAIGELEAAGLLDRGGTFRDPAIREAVLAGWAVNRRVATHARVARVLHANGRPPAVIAEHLIAGEPVADPWAVPVLVQAAERALANAQADFAVRALREALGACSDVRQKSQVRLALVRAQWRISPSAAAGNLNDLMNAVAAGHLERADAISLIAYLLWFGWTDQVEEILALLDPPLTSLAAKDENGLVDLWLRCAYPNLFARLGSEAPPLTVDDALRSHRSPLTRAGALLGSVLLGGEQNVLTLAEKVLQSARLDDRGVLAIGGTLMALIYAHRLDEAAASCDVLLAEESIGRAPAWRAVLLALRSVIALRRGRITEAERHVDTALSLISVESWSAAIGLPVSNAVLIKTAMGKHEEAAAWLEVPLPDATGKTLGGLHYLYARGRHYLATGRPHAALDDFQVCGDTMSEWGLCKVPIVPWAAGAAEALVVLGDREGARDLAGRALAALESDQDAIRGWLVRVLAMSGRTAAEGRDRLNEAADLFRRLPDSYELARTLAELAQAHRAMDEQDQARLVEQEALELAQDNGFQPVKPTLAALWEPAAFERLTGAERRVATLAASGDSNREISDKLYITISTVEQHLTRVYRKLNVGKRSDLPARLSEGAAGDRIRELCG